MGRQILKGIGWSGKLHLVPLMVVVRVGAGRDQTRVRIHFADGLAECLRSGVNLVLGRVARVPTTPKFITQLPEPAAFFVAPTIVYILDPLRGLLRSSRTEVQGDLWLCSNEFAEA